MLRSILVLSFLVASTASAQPATGPDPSSGFLTDYSILQPSAGGQVGQFIYVAPDAAARLANVNAVLVDQPALVIAPDSKYKAVDPNDAKLIADTFQQLITNQLDAGYIIAVRPDPGVIEVRIALSNVYLQKKPRRLLSYTPIGLVVNAAKNALEDVMQKMDLTEVAIQAEILESQTGEILVEMYDQKGNIASADQHTSWQQVEDAMTLDAKRLKCNLDNAHSPPGARTNCWAITGATP